MSDDDKAREMVEAFRPLGELGKHTPEPFDKPMDPSETWTQCPNNGYDILVENGDFVGAFVHDDTYASTSRARCARAVSCVNALAGVADPAATLAEVREAMRAADEVFRLLRKGWVLDRVKDPPAFGLVRSALAKLGGGV